MRNSVISAKRKIIVERDGGKSKISFQSDIKIKNMAMAEMTAGPNMKKRLAKGAPGKGYRSKYGYCEAISSKSNKEEDHFRTFVQILIGLSFLWWRSSFTVKLFSRFSKCSATCLQTTLFLYAMQTHTLKMRKFIPVWVDFLPRF